MARTVLIIDDQPSFRTSARNVLEDGGFVVIAAGRRTTITAGITCA